MKLYEEEVKALTEIVNDVFLVDIIAKSSKRDVVDARQIYSKILREKGYGYESIGRSIKKNHATVVHYIKNIDSLLTYDKQLRDKYMTCKVLFYKDREAITNELRKDVDIYMTVIRLRGELQQAVSNKSKVLNEFVSYIERYEKLRGRLPGIDDYRSTILPLFDV
jgi:CO dehydrogenase/acetyl-CoA synthase beta subunit